MVCVQLQFKRLMMCIKIIFSGCITVIDNMMAMYEVVPTYAEDRKGKDTHLVLPQKLHLSTD